MMHSYFIPVVYIVFKKQIIVVAGLQCESNSVAIVISPLIALIRDQVKTLKKKDVRQVTLVT